MITNVFLKQEDKLTTTTGFSKDDFKYHKGVSGLKYYLIVMYLRKHAEIFGEVSFTLEKLLKESGYKTSSNNVKMYDDFRRIIHKEIIQKGYASSNDDILTITPKKLYTMQLSDDKNIFFTNKNFVQMSISDYDKIAQSETGSVGKSVLAGVYLYIKQFIMADSYSDQIKISYPSKNQIKKGIGIKSDTTISTAISSLESIGMIYVYRGMYIKNKNNKELYVPARNVYALNKRELKEDAILSELEGLYGCTVYKDADVPRDKKKFLCPIN